MKGDMLPVFVISSYSYELRPDLDNVPSFLNLGTTCLTSTHLGLNVSCTSCSTSAFLLFNELKRNIAACSSKRKPLSVCCCKICEVLCSNSIESLEKPGLSFLKCSKTFLFTRTS